MTDHLPECLVPDFDQGLWICICNQLRACEQRVLEEHRHRCSGCDGCYSDGVREAIDAAREAVDRLASEMANWSSAETVAATGAVPDLTADQWMWAQRGVWRALAAIDALKEGK